MREKNLPAALATSVTVSLFVAACVDPSVLRSEKRSLEASADDQVNLPTYFKKFLFRIHGVEPKVCPNNYIGLSSIFIGAMCAESGETFVN